MIEKFTREEDKRLVAIRKAKAEARRFLEKCELAENELRNSEFSFSPTVHFAAAKRASMDLTRALADVRRNPHS